MRISLATMALCALFACKGDRSSTERSGATEQTSAAPSDERPVQAAAQDVFKPGDTSAAGYVLQVLSTVDAPRLDGAPSCADYAGNLRSLFADMSQTLRRLRQRAQTGVRIEELLSFAGWLDTRAGMLEHLSRSRSMTDDELGRRHREFSAAASDLASALSDSYSSRDNELAAADITRLHNAADNFAATVRALEEQCLGQ